MSSLIIKEYLIMKFEIEKQSDEIFREAEKNIYRQLDFFPSINFISILKGENVNVDFKELRILYNTAIANGFYIDELHESLAVDFSKDFDFNKLAIEIRYIFTIIYYIEREYKGKIQTIERNIEYIRKYDKYRSEGMGKQEALNQMSDDLESGKKERRKDFKHEDTFRGIVNLFYTCKEYGELDKIILQFLSSEFPCLFEIYQQSKESDLGKQILKITQYMFFIGKQYKKLLEDTDRNLRVFAEYELRMQNQLKEINLPDKLAEDFILKELGKLFKKSRVRKNILQSHRVLKDQTPENRATPLILK